MKKHILNHVDSSVSSDQHGFISGRSCTSNLLEAFDTIIDMMDEGLPVDLSRRARRLLNKIPVYLLLECRASSFVNIVKETFFKGKQLTHFCSSAARAVS